MLFKSLLTSVLLTTTGLISLVKAADLPPIEVVGNKFFYSNNGSQFYMKGIAYQQNTQAAKGKSFVDPLADIEACKRDIPYMIRLQTNVIRVYALDVTLDHTECMKMLSDAGIYVIADLSVPDLSINRDDPEWSVGLFDRYTGVIDLFQNYTNVLGFFAGNEVTNEKKNTDASAFVKAAIRDCKAYIKKQGYRKIPVGYSANDDTDIRVSLADYFACGNEDERADFFGINMYEWCGESSFKKSGFQSITEEYKNLGIPLFFSEYGCNEVTPRKFQEVRSLYSKDMTDLWSGGIVYMYFQEENNYGLITLDNGRVKTLDDFNYYSSEIAKISPTYATSASTSVTVTTCPTATANWEASTKLPPTPDNEICNCISKSVSCVVRDDVSPKDYKNIFGYICSNIDCRGINSNGTTGSYGAFSPCSAKDKLNFVLDLYYRSRGSSNAACNFDGSAILQQASTVSTCSAIMKSAGPLGLGTVSGTIRTTKHTGIVNDSPATGSPGSDSTATTVRKSSSPKQFLIDSITKSLLIGLSIMFGAGLVIV